MISILHLINLNDLVISVIFKKKKTKTNKQKQTHKPSKNKQNKTKANI